MSPTIPSITCDRSRTLLGHLTKILNDSSQTPTDEDLTETRHTIDRGVQGAAPGTVDGPLAWAKLDPSFREAIIDGTQITGRYGILAGRGRDEITALVHRRPHQRAGDLDERHEHDHNRRYDWIQTADLTTGDYGHASRDWKAPTMTSRGGF